MSNANARLLLAASSLLCASLTTSCAQPTTSTTLATYDHGAVELDELDLHMLDLPDSQRQPPPGRSVSDWLEGLVLDIAIEDTLIARAHEEGAEDDPALRLGARYMASRQIGAVFAQERCPEADITDAEVEEAHDLRGSREPRPWILLRHIFKRVPVTAPTAHREVVRAEMEALLGQLDGGASFIDLAREHSESQTAGDGGLIGRVSRGAPMEAAVLDAGWSLPDGGHSGVIAVGNGFHIVRRDGSGVEQAPTVDVSRERLRLQMVRERRERCGQDLVHELARTSVVVVDLRAALDPSPDAVVVTVGGEEFTAEQLRGLSEDGALISELQNLPAVLQNFVEAILLAEAARAESDELAERYAKLESDGLRRLMLAQRWSTERLRYVATKPDEELESYHRAHADRFASDVKIDVSVIVVQGSGPTADRTVHERAWAVRDRITGGEPFADVAQGASDHSSSERGGRLGSVPLPKLRAMLGADGFRAVAGLDSGQVSEPFRVTAPPSPSWALVTVHEREQPQPRAFEEVRAEVVAALARERIQSLDRELRDLLRDEIRFQVQEKALESYIRGLGAEGE